MPKTLTNFEADPVTLENPVPASIFRYGDADIAWYNPTTKTVYIGEPILFGGRIWISKMLIKPGEIGTICQGSIIDAPCPTLSADILQGDTIWWNVSDNAEPYPCGRIKVTEPTNGFLLGIALINPDNLRLNVYDQGIAATTGDAFVRVLTYRTGVVAIGTISDFT